MEKPPQTAYIPSNESFYRIEYICMRTLDVHNTFAFYPLCGDSIRIPEYDNPTAKSVHQNTYLTTPDSLKAAMCRAHCHMENLSTRIISNHMYLLDL